MSNIGICLSGHTRNFYSVPYFLALRDILEKNGISTSFYLSTWDIDGYNLGIYKQSKNYCNNLQTSLFLEAFDAKALEIENHASELIQSEVENVAIKFQEAVLDPRPSVTQYDRPHEIKTTILHMFRKAERSFNMVKFKHDVLLRSRFDIYFNVHIVASQVIDIIQQKSDTIVVPSNFSFGGEHHDGGGRMCDSFAIGSFRSMEKYFHTYSSMVNGKITPEYLAENQIWFTPHSILRNNLLMDGIMYREMDIGYSIRREGGPPI